MLEIRTNLYNQIILKESDESTGIGTLWNFKVLQEFIKQDKPNKDILPYIVRYSLKQFEDLAFIRLTDNERSRLEKDLERAIVRMYYTKDIRPFRTEIVEGYFKFYNGTEFIKSITTLRFERDLVLENAVSQKPKKKKEKLTKNNDETLEEMEEDLIENSKDLSKMSKKKNGKTPKEVAISCINYVLEDFNLSDDEIEKLSEDMINSYNNWKEKELYRSEMIERLKK